LRQTFTEPAVRRAITNSVLIGVVGGLGAVVFYAALAIASHRRSSPAIAALDYVMLMPRAIPGLVIGLAFLWVFLFIPFLKPLRPTLVSVWVAFMVVYMAYGIRLVSGTLMQVGPELAEAARTCGSSAGRTLTDVTLPLIRNGLLTSWLLIFLMFEREYATGVYLLTRGTETIGAMIVSLAESGDVGLLAALSLVNVALVGIGLGLALRLGVKING
jgi:iron(III) transport system permease protein